MTVRHHKRLSRPAACLAAAALVSGCASEVLQPVDFEPVLAPMTQTQQALRELPPPAASVPVAVYAFNDVTGQFKPSETVQTLSRAVTQGGAELLIEALRDAGGGRWFTVVERSSIDSLFQERNIIREMRRLYLGEDDVNPNALPPLTFAGVILQGGIVGFDTNTLTGGAGARFLGIGGDVKYRQNTVTVSLRAVSVKTGEVISNVSASKTILSVSAQGGAFKYIDFDELLEVEAGITANEPASLAVRRAIEKAVHGLVLEGVDKGAWAFSRTTPETNRLVSAYVTGAQTATFTSTRPPQTAAAERARAAAAPSRDRAARAPAHRAQPAAARVAAAPTSSEYRSAPPQVLRRDPVLSINEEEDLDDS